MSKFFKLSIFASILAIAFVFAFSSSLVQANDYSETFNLDVFHNINGRSLGLERDLPVDVYVNGNPAFTFSFRDSVSV